MIHDICKHRRNVLVLIVHATWTQFYKMKCKWILPVFKPSSSCFSIYLYNGSAFSHTQLLNNILQRDVVACIATKGVYANAYPVDSKHFECIFRLGPNGVFFFLFYTTNGVLCTMYMYHLIRRKFLAKFFPLFIVVFCLFEWVSVCHLEAFSLSFSTSKLQLAWCTLTNRHGWLFDVVDDVEINSMLLGCVSHMQYLHYYACLYSTLYIYSLQAVDYSLLSSTQE